MREGYGLLSYIMEVIYYAIAFVCVFLRIELGTTYYGRVCFDLFFMFGSGALFSDLIVLILFKASR